MNSRHQMVIAFLVFLLGGLVSWLLLLFSPESGQHEEIAVPPTVQVMQVTMQTKHLHVRSQGLVAAHTEIDLITDVSGYITDIAATFVSGGFFRKGDVLITIDPADYDLQIAQGQAQVKEARHQLVREEAEAAQARDEWEHLGQGDPSPLTQRIPQVLEMRAKLAAAKATLRHAKLLRQRTQIRAPFDGRVRSKNTGIGQYVAKNTVLGVIYSSDRVEVRLPVDTRELAFVDLPDTLDPASPEEMPRVILTADFQSKKPTWFGRIVRSEGLVDRATGMLMLVAQIYDPFNRALTTSNAKRTHQFKRPNLVELPIGLFVEALIQGRKFNSLAILPASALFKDNRVAVLDEDNRLRLRAVKVLKRAHSQVMIQSGLSAGERVMVSGLLQPVDGMQVTPELLSADSIAHRGKEL